jgi:hypothetical protein
MIAAISARTRVTLWLLCALALAACSATATLRPEPIHTELAPLSWPSNAVKITVEDRRADREASAPLTDAIEQSLRQALAPARPEPCPCFTLTVAVLVHRGVFPGGGGRQLARPDGDPGDARRRLGARARPISG